MPRQPRYRMPSWHTETGSRWHSQATLLRRASRRYELRLQKPAWNSRSLSRRWLGSPCSTHCKSEAARHSCPCQLSASRSRVETPQTCLFLSSNVLRCTMDIIIIVRCTKRHFDAGSLASITTRAEEKLNQIDHVVLERNWNMKAEIKL